MQRDTHLTFGQIHGDEERFKSVVNELEELALTDADGKYCDLRFLQRFEPAELGFTGVSSDENVVHLLLTEPMDPKGQSYYAISYTWAHHEPSVNLDSLPLFLVWDCASPNPTPRKAVCPALVLHRVTRFVGRSYFWIDQECIVQTDPTDVETHLQCMHLIYSMSSDTVCILAYHIAKKRHLKLLEHFSRMALPKSHMDADTARLCKQVFTEITRDPWFTRTWTFHEKNCARYYTLLIPCDVGVYRAVQGLQLTSNALHYGYEWIRKFVTSEKGLEQIYRKHFTVNNWLEPLTTRFDSMETCDNSMLSDRIAIFANVLRLQTKLKTTLLRHSRISYSTCIFVLLKNNLFSRDYWVELFKVVDLRECTIRDILSRLGTREALR